MATTLTSPTQRARWYRSDPGSKNQRAGLLFVLPSVVFMLIFFVVPLGMAIWISLHDWPLFGNPSFAGTANYMSLARDEQFWRSFWFTTKYALLVTPPIFVLGFAMALLMNRAIRGLGVFRTVFFLPNVVGFGAACLLWYFMLNDQFGIINTVLRQIGVISGSLLWLSDYTTAMIIIIIMVVWKTAGGTMLLLLLGMQSIPDELYNAAMVDGAGSWTRLTHITLPLMKRAFALALVLSITGSYLAFDQFYILTRGGPQNQTVTLVFLVTNTAFSAFRIGYATTISIALLVILVVLNAVQLFFLRDSTEY